MKYGVLFMPTQAVVTLLVCVCLNMSVYSFYLSTFASIGAIARVFQVHAVVMTPVVRIATVTRNCTVGFCPVLSALAWREQYLWNTPVIFNSGPLQGQFFKFENIG